MNNSGDILETALILGKHFGAAYDADAERYIRAHILPAQLRDVSFIPAQDDPNLGDGGYRVAQRLRGAFGFPAPYGHLPKRETLPDGRQDIECNLDIVGGAVASLCAALQAAATFENGVHRVRLYFDRDTEQISVRSDYPAGKLRITVKTPGPFYVRIPSWVKREELRFSEEHRIVDGRWLFVADPAPGREMELSFPLTRRELLLPFGDGALRARLEGDLVTAMENEGMDLTFFPDYGEESV